MGMFDDVIDNVGEPFKGGKGFEYGTHEVLIMLAEPQKKKTRANPEAQVIVVSVADPEDTEQIGYATLYFHTEGGAKMSVAKVLGILVHNAGEEKKETVRTLGKKLFASIDDPVEACEVAAKLINDKMIGKKAFFVVEPQGSYKTSSYGDLWHYAAKPQGEPRDEAESVAKDMGGSVADADDLDLPEDL